MERRKFLPGGMALGTLTAFPGLSYSNKEVMKRGKKRKQLSPLADTDNEAYEKRRQLLLEYTAESNITPEALMDTSKDMYSNLAIANLALYRHITEANKRIRHTVRWFEHPY
ncbi:MAG: hypothetical protein AAGU19_16120 [Prolixibacteraceae bacterium]